MKAPLRFALGWVIYVAIFAAIHPVVLAIQPLVFQNPVASVVTMTISFVVLIAMFFYFGRRFFRWIDQPRRRP